MKGMATLSGTLRSTESHTRTLSAYAARATRKSGLFTRVSGSVGVTPRSAAARREDSARRC